MEVLATLLTEKDTWQTLASIATTISVVFLIVGPRTAIVRKWVGAGLQEMLGVTKLQSLMTEEIEARAIMHRANQREFRNLRRQVDEVSTLAAEVSERVETHLKDEVLHDRNGKS